MNYYQIYSDGFEGLYRTLLPEELVNKYFLELQEEDERDELLESLGIERVFVTEIFI